MTGAASSEFDRKERGAGRVALGSVKARPGVFAVAALASSLVVTVALVVVGSFSAGDRLADRFVGSTGVVVVVKPGASPEQREAIRLAIGSVDGSGTTQAASVDEMVQASSAGVDPDSKQLPALIRARAAPTVPNLERWVGSLRQALNSLPMVESVRVDESWVRSTDRWKARWQRLKSDVGVATAVFLGTLLGTIWFLAIRSFDGNAIRASTYLSAGGVAIAILVSTIGVWTLGTWLEEIVPIGDPEWRNNVLFIFGFSAVAALSGAKSATFFR